MKGAFRIIAVFIVVLVLILVFLTPWHSVSRTVFSLNRTPEVYLLYGSSGSMSELLITDQIDAFIIWEPVVANAELAGTGRMIATPGEMPPPGRWADAASCVFLLRNDIIRGYPDISALLSALTTAGINRINEDPELAVNITAAWVYGTEPVLTPQGSLDPIEIEQLSFENLVFTPEASIPALLDVQDFNSPGVTVQNDSLMSVDSTVYNQGLLLLNGTASPVPDGEPVELSLGYLPSSDNFAPLYVMVQDSSYFCEKYGFCLVPDKPSSRPSGCTLYVNDTPVALVNLVPAQSGGGIMTSVGQGAMNGAYVGSIPAESQMALGNPASIIQSINSGGTGLVVGNRAPCTDWDSFVRWARFRSDQGRPLVMYLNLVSSQYFRTMGIPLVAGRDFEPGDRSYGDIQACGGGWKPRFPGCRAAVETGRRRDRLCAGSSKCRDRSREHRIGLILPNIQAGR